MKIENESILVHSFTLISNKTSYIILYCDYPEYAFQSAHPSLILNEVVDSLGRELDGTLEYEKRGRLADHQGAEVQFLGPRKLLTTARIFLVGNRVFQLLVLQSQSLQAPTEQAWHFLDSFRLIGPDADPNSAGWTETPFSRGFNKKFLSTSEFTLWVLALLMIWSAPLLLLIYKTRHFNVKRDPSRGLKRSIGLPIGFGIALLFGYLHLFVVLGLRPPESMRHVLQGINFAGVIGSFFWLNRVMLRSRKHKSSQAPATTTAQVFD